VGYFNNGTVNQPYSMNWNGSVWTTVVPPTVGTTGSFLDSAARIPGTMTLWGVGGSLNADGSFHDNLIEKFHC